MSSVTFPPDLGGDGSTVTDDNNATTGLDDGGHVYRFVPALAQTVVMASTAKNKAAEAKASADAALIAKALAEAAAAGVIAISLNVPSGLPSLRPSLLLDFVNGERIDPRVTFTRASSATRVNKKGYIESVAAHVPRINHDPLTLVCKGLLREESRTNLLTYSEQADHANWTKSNANITISATNTLAPDGNATADTANVAVGGTDSCLLQSVSGVTNGQLYSGSIFVKAATAGYAVLHLQFTGGGTPVAGSVLINLSTGATTVLAQTATVVMVPTVSYINGFYKVGLTVTNNSTGNTSLVYRLYPSVDSSGNTPAIGSAIVWGMQLELGNTATSYIPTTSASVTRSADAVSLTGSHFSSWFNANEGTIVASGDMDTVASGNAGLYRIDDGSDSNRIMVRNNGSGDLDFRTISAGSSVSNLEGGNTLTAGATFTHAASYKLDSFIGVFNGGNVLTDSGGAVPVSPTRMLIGETSGAGSVYLNGHIKKILYYPKQLTSIQMQRLTV